MLLRPVGNVAGLFSFTGGASNTYTGSTSVAGNGTGEESFASVLAENLGPTICEHFYFPYARKIWGVGPDRLSAIQARRRVSASR